MTTQLSTSNICLNTYSSFKFPTINNTIQLQEWIELIKNPTNNHKQIIEIARNLDKKDSLYNKLKEQLPTITYNATFQCRKDRKNVLNLTGLMYIDIDKQEYDINSLDKSKIYMLNKSFGGKGYSILVKYNSDSVKISNFNEAYVYVIKELGLETYYDTSCNDITRQNVLSYDSDVYINENSYCFQIPDYIKSKDNFVQEVKTPPIRPIIKKERMLDRRGGENLIYTNIEEVKETINFGCNHHYTNWDGIEVIECSISLNKVKNGNRNTSLFAYCKNLVYLNKNIERQYLINIMKNVNKLMCFEPVEYKELISIIESVLKQLKNNTLIPKTTKRKILFNSKDLTKQDKNEIVLKLVNEKKTNDSKQKIYDIIENWDFKTFGKISQAKIINNNKVSKKTVEKYWSEFKEYVKDLNNNN